MTGPMYLLLALWSFAVFAGSHALGRRLLRWGGWEEILPAGRSVLAIGLGIVVLSYVVFFAAALHFLSPPLLWGISAAWFLLAVLDLIPTGPRRTAEPRKFCPVQTFLLLVLGGVAVLNLVPALTPAVDWDGVAYHLALPKLYLAAGGLVFRPDIFHNLFPQLTEMLYLLGLVFPFGVAAKLVHFGLGLLAAAAVHAACRQSGLRGGAWLGAAIFYLQFLVHIESGTAFIDLASAAYAGLALIAFQRALQPGAPMRWLSLSLFMAGACAATKWHGLIVLVLVGGLAMIRIWTSAEPAAVRLGHTVRVWSWGGLPVLPYLVRAWLQGGNPVWPLAHGWFGGRNWDAEIAQRTTAAVQAFAGWQTGWTGLARLPVDLIVHGDRFGVGGHELRWPLLGLVLLALAAWRFAGPREPRGADASGRVAWPVWTSAAAAAFLVAWFFSSPQVRFLLPLFPITAWLAARGLADLWRRGRMVPRAAAAVCVLLLFAVHPPVHRDTWESVQTVLGLRTPEAFITPRLEHYPACLVLNRRPAAGERVLLFGENRGFYLDGEYLWGDPLLQQVIDYRRLRTPGELASRLETLRVRWVLFRTDLYGPDTLDPHSLGLMQALLSQAGDRVWQQGPVSVYRLDLAGRF
jgi:hypothetical protein